MIPGAIENRFRSIAEEKGAAFTVLLDPDNYDNKGFVDAAVKAADGGADVLFVGGSMVVKPDYPQMIAEAKRESDLPLVLFPGGASQIAPGLDATLFTTLVSGRNPQYLIDEQVRGALMVRALKMEAIPTAYILVDGGRTTAVEYVSNTRPIPADKPKLTAATAMASSLMGMRWAYLEAGSGALNPVPLEHVGAVKKMCPELQLIVGGGITTPELAGQRVQAGASMIVTGNLWEKTQDVSLFKEFADAIHQQKKDC